MDTLLGTLPRIQLALSHLRSGVMRPKPAPPAMVSSPTSTNQGIHRGDPPDQEQKTDVLRTTALELTRIPSQLPEQIYEHQIGSSTA
jgi:hypothetical protein